MQSAILAITAYVVATFVASALIVRFAPRAHSSRHIRKNLILFTVLPILLVVDILSTIDLLRRACRRMICAAFELLSGRSLYSNEFKGYAYFGYSRRRHNRRKGDRQATGRAAGKVKVANS